jgi:hypothetical protein
MDTHKEVQNQDSAPVPRYRKIMAGRGRCGVTLQAAGSEPKATVRKHEPWLVEPAVPGDGAASFG